ncbi:hypothetical protein [Chitinophaga eiseniae]|uniref:Uncharacterized protein n=1 Tax=Chitinophaga eiseniae TaxID=634771 RepID=A0A847SJ76_9BACT|nr:hypothetical protein [Chitinophaga eiseniae]NLR80204.1 hypothetical protein [Chitinophaga eiseniae]
MQDEKFHYSKVEVATVPLSGTLPMDIYFNSKKVADSLGADVSFSFMTPGGITAKLAVYKAGTDTLIVDTLITTPLSGAVAFRIGYSEELGLRGFLGGPVSISTDSCRFQLFNNFPEVLQPDGVNIDAHLCYYDMTSGEQVETGIVFHGFTKKKLHPDVVTVPIKDATGAYIQYTFKFRNIATGEFLKDEFNNELLGAGLSSYEGKYGIIATAARFSRGRYTFAASFIAL